MRKPKIKNWIYVTGAPRSGTTFVGKMLSASMKVDYIHEPFNPDCGIPGIEKRFLYIRNGSAESLKYENIIRKIFTYDFHLKNGLYEKDSSMKKAVKRIVGSRGPFYLRLAKINPFHEAAVIKDPTGCLVTEYMARNYGVKPVILIRHPMAFVSSVLRVGWNLNLDVIRSQSHLINDYFSDEKEFISKKTSNYVEAISYFWRAVNTVLLSQYERNRGWHLIVHESLSQEPIPTFRNLYYSLNLPWSNRIEHLITRNTRKGNRVEAARGRVQDFKRDSAKLSEYRTNSLPLRYRQVIYNITKDLALDFYSKESFELN